MLHLAKGKEHEGLVLCCIDTFSRYAIVTLIADTKSLTIATAIRDQVLKHGWGRPETFVLDGASYFKAEVAADMQAWEAIMRVSAPHHAESHRIVERFNETYARTLKTFGAPIDWQQNYAAANEAYNRSVHKTLSAAGMPLTPLEVWRPGQVITPYSVPETTLMDSVPKDYQEHYKEHVRLHHRINECVQIALKEYNEHMVNMPNNLRRQAQLRTFKVGDTITHHKATGNKTIDKSSALQQGPYVITEADYTIQRQGSSEPPIRVHVDKIKSFKVFVPPIVQNRAEGDSDYDSNGDDLLPASPATAAKTHNKRYEVQQILAERRLSPRDGGQVQILLQWKPSESTS